MISANSMINMSKDPQINLHFSLRLQGKIHFVTDGAGGIDPLTFKQITTRFIEWDSRGKLRVEPKDKMAERGLKSPDRADGALGCIMVGAHLNGAISADVVENSSSGASAFSTGHVKGF